MSVAVTAEAMRLAARRDDPERYLLSLFYPAAARPHVWAFTAFAAELAAIPEKASEEMLGLIRLAWWREALDAIHAGHAPPEHPVLRALAAAIATLSPPRLWFDAMLEARTEQIEAPRLAGLDGYARFAQATAGMLARLSALGITRDPLELEIAGQVGELYGMVGLYRSLPHQLAQGVCLLPEASLISCDLSLDEMTQTDPAALASDPRWSRFRQEFTATLSARHAVIQPKGPTPVLLQHFLSDRWLHRLERLDPLKKLPLRLRALPMRLVWRTLFMDA